MTVPVQDPFTSHVGNGVTATFAYNFLLYLKTDLTVTINNIAIGQDDFSITGLGEDNGGTITILAGPAAVGIPVVLIRQLPLERLIDYQTSGDFRAPTVNADFDRIWQALQDSIRDSRSSLRYPFLEGIDGTLQDANARKGMLLGFDPVNGIHTMVPQPSSIGAGDRITYRLVSGVDFTPGATSVTLPRAPAAPGNLEVFWDGTAQSPITWSVVGTTLNFSTAIPAYITEIWGYIGTTLSQLIPPDDSIGVNQLIFGNSLTRAVDNLAALRQLPKAKYTRSEVFGHTTVWDGGGGSYYQDPSDNTSADNDGTIIVAADGARWKLRHYGAVSALQFGVRADNVTDDGPALLRALASGQTGVRDLYLPAGHIYSSLSLNLCNFAQIGFSLNVRGCGMLRDDGGNTAGTYLRIEPGVGKNCVEQLGSQFITWQDVKIVSTGVNGASAGIVVARTPQADFAQNNKFDRVMVITDRAGSTCFYNNCAEQADIRGCWFEGPRPFIWALAAEGAPATQYATINNATFTNTCHSVDNNTFVATDGPGMWLIGVGTLNGGGNLIKKGGGNPYTGGGILLQSSGAGYQNNYNHRFHAQVEDFNNAVRMEGQTFGVQMDISCSNIQSHIFSLGAASVHHNPRLAACLLNTPGAFNAIGADPAGANIFGGQFVIPPNAVQVDTNLGLRGTLIDGTNHDLSNPAVLSVAAGSSFTPLWQFSEIHLKENWTPGLVASPGNSLPHDFAFAGAAIGDHIDVTFPYAAQGCQVTGSVDTAGQIRLIIQNITGSNVTFGAGTFKVTLSRKPNAN